MSDSDERALRDRLEALQARLAKLREVEARGFDAVVQRQLDDELAQLGAERTDLETQLPVAERLAETSQRRLFEAVQRWPIDLFQLPPWERRLIQWVDGGRIWAAMVGLAFGTLATLLAVGSTSLFVKLGVGLAGLTAIGWAAWSRPRGAARQPPVASAEEEGAESVAANPDASEHSDGAAGLERGERLR